MRGRTTAGMDETPKQATERPAVEPIWKSGNQEHESPPAFLSSRFNPFTRIRKSPRLAGNRSSKPTSGDTAPARGVWRRFLRNRPAVVGSILVGVLVAAAGLAPWIAPYSYEAQDLALGASGPAPAHWLGTDVLGRDLLTRLLYGGRVAFLVALCGTAVSLLIGVTYGALSGYAGGRVDSLMMRVLDTLFAIPFTLFAIVLMVVFGRKFIMLFVAIGAVEWLTMARIVRGQVLSLKGQLFVRAAVLLGYGRARILLRHVLPNILGPVIVYATLTVPRVMLMEAFLSFLGLGVQPPLSSLGLLIRDGAEVMESYPWLMLFPGLTLSAVLFAMNFIGDALRDAMDPRFRGN